jgi:hypothetical protein
VGNVYFLIGSTCIGEYFNPGYDCTDILNKNKAAKDGYYWIHFAVGVPWKVRLFFKPRIKKSLQKLTLRH